jgi:hypothetical protein
VSDEAGDAKEVEVILMPTWEQVRVNPTLYSNALFEDEGESFPWHKFAHLPHSSQVFCVSAFGTLRKLKSRDDIVRDLLAARPSMGDCQPSNNLWEIGLEVEDRKLLNEFGTPQPSSIDVCLTSPDAVYCLEAKFREDAMDGFGACGQPSKRQCAGHFGPSSDLKTMTDAWCRLEVWDGERSPRLYWALGRAFFRDSVFLPQEVGSICPFNGPNYQLMRNLLWAAAYARRSRKQLFGVLVVCPGAFSPLLAAQVEEFKANVLRPEYHDAIRLRTYEDYASLLRATGEATALALATFLEGRIRDLIPHP